MFEFILSRLHPGPERRGFTLHMDNCVTGGYIRTESNTMKQAVDRIAGFIQDQVTPEIENVVSILKSV
jgi:hypothetical protein